MSRFNFQDPLDFTRLTSGSLGALVLDFAGRDPSEWVLLEGSYNGILFHVFQSKTSYQAALPRMNDTTGRRKVKYSFPYRDGQTTDDLGRKPQGFEVEVLIHGKRYQEGLFALLAEFNKPTPGVLVHPIRGRIQAVVEDVSISHSSEQRQACMMKITFSEHNFSIGELGLEQKDTTKSALSKALAAFQKIQAIVTNVEGAINFTRTIKNRIKQSLEEYSFRFGTTMTNMNATFNQGSSTDIPSLLPVNQGGTFNSDGTVTSELFVTSRSVSDPFNSVPVDQLTPETATALAVDEITKQVSALREEAAALINDIQDSGGALELYDDIIQIRQTVVLMQDVLEVGVKSSNAQVLDYLTPRDMSIREVAFANGISVEEVQQIDLLNPSLESVNFIAKGTRMRIPLS